MKSLSEIETTSKRATRASGYSWGISEEVGKCIRLLEMFGLPGLKNLNAYFKIYRQKQFQKISLISKIGGIILLFTGILILTNQLQAIGFYIIKVFPFMQNFG